MSELASHSTDYSVIESEPPEVMGRNLRVGAHLWSSATAFFFVAFLFTYFYLRSLNNHGLWRPKGVKPPVTLGTLIAIAVAVSAIASLAAARRLRAGDRGAFRSLGLVALALGIAAIVLQIVVFSTVGFGPTDGAYASVFLAWSGFYMVFVAGTMYWLEVLLATSFRYRSQVASEPGEASGDPDRMGDDIARPLSLQSPGADAFAFTWGVLAGIGVLTWIILYLI
jgi:heme/copper-type cytochrome/quinol oxidase subunit 3